MCSGLVEYFYTVKHDINMLFGRTICIHDSFPPKVYNVLCPVKHFATLEVLWKICVYWMSFSSFILSLTPFTYAFASPFYSNCCFQCYQWRPYCIVSQFSSVIFVDFSIPFYITGTPNFSAFILLIATPQSLSFFPLMFSTSY